MLNSIALSFFAPILAALLSPLAVRFGPSTRGNLPLRLAACFACALLFLQAGGMLFGFLGLLGRGSVLAWLALGAVAGLVGWVKFGLPSTEASEREASEPFAWGPWIAFGVLALFYLLMATAPPWYRDSLVYHLALPRFFAQHGGYAQPDDNIFAAFPLGWESILSLLHALGSAPDHDPVFNPRLLGVWTTVAAGLATAGLALRVGAGRVGAAFAALLWLLVPTVAEFGSSTYVEPYLVLLSTLALATSLQKDRDARASGWAAVFAGGAASVKYPGLAVVAILAFLLLVEGYRRSSEEQAAAFRRALRFGLVAAAVASPFYIRNWIERGNPFFPTAFGLFGGEGWDEWRDLHYGVTLLRYGEGRAFVDWLLLPFRLFTATSLRTGFEGSLGPVIGLGFVAGWVGRKRAGEEQRRLLAFALLWSIFWAFTVQQVRFYLVAVPALIVLLALASARLGPGKRRWASVLLAACAFAWFAPRAGELWKRQHTTEWLAGSLSEDELLTRMLPDSYPPMRELERWVPEDGKVWLVWMRGYTYYLRRPYRYDAVFEGWRLEALLDESESPDDAVERFQRDGVTHLLVHHRFFLHADSADLRPGRTELLRQRFRGLVSAGALREVQAWDQVRLYEVVGEAPRAER